MGVQDEDVPSVEGPMEGCERRVNRVGRLCQRI